MEITQKKTSTSVVKDTESAGGWEGVQVAQAEYHFGVAD